MPLNPDTDFLAEVDRAQALAWLEAQGFEPEDERVMALLVAIAQDAQFAERAWWGAAREVPHTQAEAQGCVERMELLGLIDAANAANAEAAR